MADLIILPVITLGVILGLYELFAIHADMNFRGSHWLGHGLHAVVFMIVALFAVMNVDFFLEITGLANSTIPFITNPLVLRILVGVILNIKMHGTSAVVHGGGLVARGMAEHWTHTTIITVLVIIMPYVWPFLSPIVPSYLGGG
ncbi:MAG: hypothetical protein PHD81_00980 [Candidatus Nanoarchaeia archaeon]|nr:hypothetical protein [Candidatus Nanoarchaeia archaeon]MDD5587664.1 hypothetical protein [Candidatus Nanoarchaeia archaeon]